MDKKQIKKLISENKLCIDKTINEFRKKKFDFDELNHAYGCMEFLASGKLSLELIDYKGDKEKYIDELRRYIAKKYEEDLRKIFSQFANVKDLQV